MSPVIRVENLSKKYIIGHQKPERYTALRDVLADGAKRLTHKLRHPFAVPENDATHEEFWALKDVSFDIQQGDRVGIIGRNGAGKSTLLKILSRITEPTSGRVSIKGRVASLLEVGTGFHPELTGRENIYLNGAILGMSKAEIKSKFDEIVAFAEVEKFLDTPVKRFSSGMYVRLAFAVAAHLEPEVLIVDEVLAVGDARFQRKCLDKMGEAGLQGRTVFFVSHNMAAVRQLCGRVLCLDNGSILLDGPPQESIKAYFGDSARCVAPFVKFDGIARDGTNTGAHFSWVSLHDAAGSMRRLFSIGDDLLVRFNLLASEKLLGRPIKLALQLRTADGIPLCNMTDTDSHFQLERAEESNTIEIHVPDMRFYPGEYFLSLWSGAIDSRHTFDFTHDCISFEITDGGTKTSRILPREAGLLYLTPLWKAC